MLITEKELLKKYDAPYRIWQGIPGIERSRGGRLFVTFYSGGTKEAYGNYVVLLKSDDDGRSFSPPVAVAYHSEDYRCYDPCLWVDPLGRLWFVWSIMPERAVYAVICDDPDADTLVWGDEFVIGHDTMLNKPLVTSSGRWLFPIAVFAEKLQKLQHDVIDVAPTQTKESGAFLYESTDCGKSFRRLGTPDLTARSFDEHMVLELKDGRLMMLTRTFYGISQTYSADGGHTWSEEQPFSLGGPNSRFYIRRLKSGRILLINHYLYTGRNNLTALLSDDECRTWKGRLLLDERDEVSYPDAVESEDGYIYVIYDRERGCFKKNFEEAKRSAREILMAKITEEDILCGRLTDSGSRLRQVVSRLGDYAGDAESMFQKEKKR